ncbi:pyridoxamine 5'-phosphate oxidase family protein [bacterium]|nr:pyridoxamine 5'-phosphate oxidase family protein [bacterium]
MIDVEKTIREYLPNIIHMSLATVMNNRPWVCELHYVYDDELNIYFRSTSARRHSQEIAQNNFVAGSIVAQHGLQDKARGIYFEGIAEQLLNVYEDNIAYKKYCERFGTNRAILDDANKLDGHKFYKITVNKFYIFDGRESTPARKYELDWKEN